ncbi:MAG: beta-galactosidase, partial [Clostridia bacterium]|nr:beta-galactosidase [Clostridia bacterium]
MQPMRTEYPRPQMVRSSYLCLNGEWEFEIDHGRTALESRFYEKPHLSGKINVPFCPESKLSGVGYTDFMAAVTYRKEMVLPDSFKGKRVLLHLGAVD